MNRPHPAAEIHHTALLSAPLPPLAPPEQAELTDRQRLAAVLQAGGLLAHLEHGGWYLPEGWSGAGLTREGMLRVAGGAPGSLRELPQELLRRLLLRLFRARRGIPGRGEGRRAARELLEAWEQSLAPIPPDRLVTQVLEAAAFLWKAPFADARRALAAEHRWEGEPQLWVAGPGRWRRSLLAEVEDRQGLETLLAGDEAGRLWQRFGGGENGGPSEGSPPLAQAEQRIAHGRFEAALALLEGNGSPRAEALRAWCQYQMGQLGAARATLRRLEGIELPAAERLELAEVAVRVLANGGEVVEAREWALATVRASRGRARLRAELIAATAAWDRGDDEAMARHLEASRGALEVPELAWRWHHARALQTLDRDDDEAVAHLRRALAAHRRGLRRYEAAGLWNDLGVARGRGGDLGGAERAFLHALRLFRGCDGPRRTTLALHNLAEIRLRRGRLIGVREIVERSASENRLAGNLRGQIYDAALSVRYELVQGRPEAALVLCRDALELLDRQRAEWYREELRVLAARALGWLGRSEEAAAELEQTTAEARAALEPEERPALLALAGDREGALALAGDGPAAVLWRALLTGGELPEQAWEPVETLGSYRVARLAFDCELLAPGWVPRRILRRAVATLRRIGASLPAERLEARDTGPWEAVAAYLRKERGRQEALSALFAHAGYPDVRLYWESEEDAQVVVDGPGGEEEISAPLAGGRLVLRTRVVDRVLAALFRLASGDLSPARGRDPARRPTGGIVGECAPIREALARVERLAPTDLPVLVLGESGTGKELFARQVHRRSRRAEAPFVAINCAALSESLLLSDLFGHVRGAFTGADRDRAGVFEAAQGGTVFLDEIGDLPANAQGMLLRLLQEGEVRRVGESLPRRVDVRVVTATHRDLERMVREGSFRQDLYYRLRGGRLALPPLRERGEDILRLADWILERRSPGGEPPALSAAARTRLLGHAWPGNIRELENTLTLALALAGDGPIEVEHLDLPGDAGELRTDYHQQIESLRRKLLEEALAAAGGNRAAAARRLGLSRQTFSYLARRLGLV